MSAIIVDAHVHVWSDNTERYPYQPILGYVPDSPAHLNMLINYMDKTKIDRVVLVQPSVYGWDNRYIADCLRRMRDRIAAVCLIDPLGDDPAERIAYWVREHGFSGVRLNPIGDPKGTWINDHSQYALWQMAAKLNVPICVQLLPKQLEMLQDIATDFPQVAVVIDHLAKPINEEGPESTKALHFLKLSQLPNVSVKVAALGYLSRQAYPYLDTHYLVEAALQAYGADRVIWGSDFPGILKYCTYQQSYEFIKQIIWDCSEVELSKILGGNALRLWFNRHENSDDEL